MLFKSVSLNIQDFLKYLVSLCVVLSIMLPVAVQALDVLSDSVHNYHLMIMDQQEESQKEEQQEDNTKDEKIEMRFLSSFDLLVSSTSKYSFFKIMDGASNFIQEIPIPPPERLSHNSFSLYLFLSGLECPDSSKTLSNQHKFSSTTFRR